MKYRIRLAVCSLALVGAFTRAHAIDLSAPHAGIPISHDLTADAILANKARVPLLLIFAQEHCDYCEQLDRELLNPYYYTGAFEGKVIARRVMIDSYAAMTGFNGKRVDARELATAMKVYATPAMLFVDAEGNELTERIVGINSTDFLAAYFEQSIAAAREKFLTQH